VQSWEHRPAARPKARGGPNRGPCLDRQQKWAARPPDAPARARQWPGGASRAPTERGGERGRADCRVQSQCKTRGRGRQHAEPAGRPWPGGNAGCAQPVDPHAAHPEQGVKASRNWGASAAGKRARRIPGMRQRRVGPGRSGRCACRRATGAEGGGAGAASPGPRACRAGRGGPRGAGRAGEPHATQRRQRREQLHGPGEPGEQGPAGAPQTCAGGEPGQAGGGRAQRPGQAEGGAPNGRRVPVAQEAGSGKEGAVASCPVTEPAGARQAQQSAAAGERLHRPAARHQQGARTARRRERSRRVMRARRQRKNSNRPTATARASRGTPEGPPERWRPGADLGWCGQRQAGRPRGAKRSVARSAASPHPPERPGQTREGPAQTSNNSAKRKVHGTPLQEGRVEMNEGKQGSTPHHRTGSQNQRPVGRQAPPRRWRQGERKPAAPAPDGPRPIRPPPADEEQNQKSSHRGAGRTTRAGPGGGPMGRAKACRRAFREHPAVQPGGAAAGEEGRRAGTRLGRANSSGGQAQRAGQARQQRAARPARPSPRDQRRPSGSKHQEGRACAGVAPASGASRALKGRGDGSGVGVRHQQPRAARQGQWAAARPAAAARWECREQPQRDMGDACRQGQQAEEAAGKQRHSAPVTEQKHHPPAGGHRRPPGRMRPPRARPDDARTAATSGTERPTRACAAAARAPERRRPAAPPGAAHRKRPPPQPSDSRAPPHGWRQVRERRGPPTSTSPAVDQCRASDRIQWRLQGKPRALEGCAQRRAARRKLRVPGQPGCHQPAETPVEPVADRTPARQPLECKARGRGPRPNGRATDGGVESPGTGQPAARWSAGWPQVRRRPEAEFQTASRGQATEVPRCRPRATTPRGREVRPASRPPEARGPAPEGRASTPTSEGRGARVGKPGGAAAGGEVAGGARRRDDRMPPGRRQPPRGRKTTARPPGHRPALLNNPPGWVGQTARRPERRARAALRLNERCQGEQKISGRRRRGVQGTAAPDVPAAASGSKAAREGHGPSAAAAAHSTQESRRTGRATSRAPESAGPARRQWAAAGRGARSRPRCKPATESLAQQCAPGLGRARRTTGQSGAVRARASGRRGSPAPANRASTRTAAARLRGG